VSRISPPLADRVYFDFDDAAAYLRSKGLDDATRHTIDTHYRRTNFLGKPKKAGRKLYWHRDQLDALIEKL
jgi:hypothetical protein